MDKTWAIGSEAADPIKSLEDLEQLLCVRRGVGAHESDAFFLPDYERDIHDPHLLHGMEEAVASVYKTIAEGGHILVYGDYDADGISSAAIMMLALQAIGAEAVPYLPDRDDGYGLNRTIVEDIAPNFDLIIAVDCGVSNAEEVAWLNSQGKQVIVVDHHELPDSLPEAQAVLHPRHPKGEYPWGHLCGAGMSWKLAQALLRDKRSPVAGNTDVEKWLLDLALIGTVGDVMPLLGENRAIVQFGLQVIHMGKRPGMRALVDVARLSTRSMTVEDISFRLIPLLNAAGRVGHPQSALDVLLARNDRQAMERAMKLLTLNKERQAITRRVAREAAAVLDPEAPIAFAANIEWPAGIVGLVAGQLAAKYNRPAVVVGGNGKHAVGSARTAGGINILEGLASAREHVLKLGGHAQAAGFSVAEDKVADFAAAVQDYFGSAPQASGKAKYAAEAILDHGLVQWEAMELLQRFEPYGEGNPRPLFAIQGAAVMDKRMVGKSGSHVKFRLGLQHGEVEAIGFGLAEEAKNIREEIDVLGALDINEFRGNATLQLRLEDIASAGQVNIVKGV